MSKSDRNLQILNVVTALLLVAATGLVFLYAPRETSMGDVQRIFYFHVPSAWVAGLAFLVTVVAGIAYLRTHERAWDVVASSSVEIGVVFALMNIITGAIWARPIWNTWWTWDPRLTTATITWLIYVAYLMLRAGIEDPDRRARFAAVYGIVGFVSVPITYFSIQMMRSIHPVLFGPANPLAKGSAPLTPAMLQTFLFCLFTFTVVYFGFLFNRIRLQRLNDRVEQLKAKLLSA
jgi:heme exporter protein C